MKQLPESFLHFVWEKQLFIQQDLKTSAGEPVQVLSVGKGNTNAGPDFEAAQLRIGGQRWAGNIEIHYAPQEWYLHRHHTDPAYDTVVLHVVWEDETAVPVTRSDGSSVPTVALRDKVSQHVLLRYEAFLHTKDDIPCQAHFAKVEAATFREALQHTLHQRLVRKSNEVLELLNQNQNNWEETFYQLLGKSFGFKVNAAPFLALTRNLPLRTVQKHRTNPTQVEALLLGQAGLLEAEFEDHYPQQLQREYRFLTQKYGLAQTRLSPKEWKRARVRPGNTPLVRLLQFSALLQQHQLLFSHMIEAEALKPLLLLFEGEPATYWQQHRSPDRPTEATFPKLSRATREVILLNTLIPTLWAYGWRHQKADFQEKARRFLLELKPEENRITRFWKEKMKVQLQHAADTQASLELYHEYCLKKHCLNCAVGQEALLRE